MGSKFMHLAADDGSIFMSRAYLVGSNDEEMCAIEKLQCPVERVEAISEKMFFGLFELKSAIPLGSC